MDTRVLSPSHPARFPKIYVTLNWQLFGNRMWPVMKDSLWGSWGLECDGGDGFIATHPINIPFYSSAEFVTQNSVLIESPTKQRRKGTNRTAFVPVVCRSPREVGSLHTNGPHFSPRYDWAPNSMSLRIIYIWWPLRRRTAPAFSVGEYVNGTGCKRHLLHYPTRGMRDERTFLFSFII